MPDKAHGHCCPTASQGFYTPSASVIKPSLPPGCICPGASTRAVLANWEWGQDEKELVIESQSESVLVRNEEHVVRESARNCTERLLRVERECMCMQGCHGRARLSWLCLGALLH